MKQSLIFSLFVITNSVWAGCRIWPVQECLSYPESKYGVYLDGSDVTGYCHTWDQAISRSTDLKNVGSCGDYHQYGRCKISLATECTMHPQAKYGVYVDGKDATGYCHTWDQGIESLSQLRSAGVCL